MDNSQAFDTVAEAEAWCDVNGIAKTWTQDESYVDVRDGITKTQTVTYSNIERRGVVAVVIDVTRKAATVWSDI